MGLKACLWNEDIDLTGGSASVAAALAAGIRGGFRLSGTDNILAPTGNNLRIVGILSGTETAAIADSTLTITGNPRTYTFGGTYVDSLHVFRHLGLNIPVGSEASMGWAGYDHAAACQEFCSVIFDDPAMPDPWGITPNPQYDDTLIVHPVTAARVAQTQSGHTDITGRTTAWGGAQASIPNDPNIKVYVMEIISRDVAGYCGIGLEAPGHAANLDFPCSATADEVYNMTELFGGALSCSASDPFNVYGTGVTTATNTLCDIVLGIDWGK